MINAGGVGIMRYISRRLDILKVLKQKSCFLFGPRQTGKSSLVEHLLGKYRTYNLLETDTFLKLSRAPERLREEYTAKDKIIIIDEIQRLPILLNEVHALIESKGVHFLLTGSSARKFRRTGVNLLGGRARVRHLHPLSFCELGKQFNLERAINYGLLPSIYFSDAPEEDLASYIGLYLKEEIAAEGLVRNIPAFSRFLEVAAWCNARLMNYTKIANDAQVARSTIQEYVEILKDTLIAEELPAWGKSKRRKPITTSKYYLFDMGVTRILQNRSLIRVKSPEFGEALESYIFHELKCYVDYCQAGPLNYWRSTSGYEVDFILADEIAIEVKGSEKISYQDLKNLKALQEEKKLKHYFLVCLEKTARTVSGIQVMPWKQFLELLWEGSL